MVKICLNKWANLLVAKIPAAETASAPWVPRTRGGGVRPAPPPQLGPADDVTRR